jgi:hypothetical protein
MLQACAQAVDFKVGPKLTNHLPAELSPQLQREATARTSINLNNDVIAAHRDKRLLT